MDERDLQDRLDVARADALMVDTLCLMGRYATEPRTEFRQRIIGNLRILADRSAYSAELRTIFAKLARRWERPESPQPGDGFANRTLH